MTQIARLLQVPSEERRELRQALRRLVEERKLQKLDRRHYALPQRSKQIVGRVWAHRNGYGFLIPEDHRLPDIFLSRREMGHIMHRDRVSLQIPSRKPKGRGFRRVLEVLERAHRRVVGRLEIGEDGIYVIPDDPRLTPKIRIPRTASRAIQGEMIVLAEITKYPTQRDGPEGRIVKVLGSLDDPGIDTEVVIHKYELPHEFPAEALAEAAEVPDEISASTRSRRKDLRDLNFFTIDGETARDHDDAVAIARNAQGHFQLWVAIADVSHYVKEGSPLDQEAFRRGTSVYFPERALPMFPPRLSNGICSLNPEEDRLCMTVAMEIDTRGRRIRSEILPSIIRSRARLTYPMVQKMLEFQDRQLIQRFPEIARDLAMMAELCKLLYRTRMRKGAIDLDLPEAEVILRKNGEIKKIVRAERHIGHRIIEEFMIAANETVAQFLSEKDFPYIHRIHEPPDAEKIEAFQTFLSHLGYPLDIQGKIRPKVFQELIDRVRGKREERSIHYALLRSMPQARYCEKSLGHFALAMDKYLHFTSPIRRYPDLVVHRILKEALRPDKPSQRRRKAWESRLPTIALHCSERERLAMEAERDLLDRKKVRFMKDKVGRVFEGTISGVTSFGLFVELQEYFVEGLVPIRNLPKDHYQWLESRQSLLGERSRKQYRLGDPVRVSVEAVSLETRQIDFRLEE